VFLFFGIITSGYCVGTFEDALWRPFMLPLNSARYQIRLNCYEKERDKK